MSFSRKLETASNVATIIVAALLSAVLIKVYLLPTPVPRRRALPEQIKAGASLKARLAGVDWQKNGRTLVLAISTQCHFCNDSAPFFRKLAVEAGKDVKLLAVLPQPVTEARQYLAGEGVHVDQIKQAALGTIGVRGTPTMLLVDEAGTVTNVWVGELQPDRQNQVLSVLTGAPATSRPTAARTAKGL